MKYCLIFLVIFSFSSRSFSQDTIIVDKLKGILFLSDYNFQYDWDSSEIRPVGFHDFFYPIDTFDFNLLTKKSSDIIFKNGIRVDFIYNRKVIKEKAKAFECIDTSRCYTYTKFYLIPVEVTCTIYSDNWPLICNREYYNLNIINGSQLKFEYHHEAMFPKKIIVSLNSMGE